MSKYVSPRAKGFSFQLIEFMNIPSCILNITDVNLNGIISECNFPLEYEDKIMITEIDIPNGKVEVLAYSEYKNKKVQKWILYTPEPEFTASYLRTFFHTDYAWNFEERLHK
jgi:hypothetical protein